MKNLILLISAVFLVSRFMLNYPVIAGKKPNPKEVVKSQLPTIIQGNLSTRMVESWMVYVSTYGTILCYMWKAPIM